MHIILNEKEGMGMGNFQQGNIRECLYFFVSMLQTDGKESSQYEYLVGRVKESI